jgi:transcriptional regulator with XRE-family HTH domain
MPGWKLSKEEMLALIEPKSAKPLDQALYERSYWQWYRSYWSIETDEEFEKLSNVELTIESGWLRAIRRAQLYTLVQIAKRLGISEAAYAKLEKSELEKKITMKRLQEAAAALQCEVVYFLRPKNKIRFSEIVWRELYEMCKCSPMAAGAPEKKRHRVLAAVVKREFAKLKVRKEMGWSLKREQHIKKQSRFFFY